LGESRAIYSENKSQSLEILSKEHNAYSIEEENRIKNAGGYILK
jgi:hypothetical protein